MLPYFLLFLFYFSELHYEFFHLRKCPEPSLYLDITIHSRLGGVTVCLSKMTMFTRAQCITKQVDILKIHLFVQYSLLRVVNVADIVCAEFWGYREHDMILILMEFICN